MNLFFSFRYCCIKSPMEKLFLRLAKSCISLLIVITLSPLPRQWRKKSKCKKDLAAVCTEKVCQHKGTAYMVFLMPSQPPITIIRHDILQIQKPKCKNAHEVFRTIDHQNNNIWHLSHQRQA